MRTSSADVDALIGWATEAAARFPWATWVPDPRDHVIVSAVQPPLTFSIVLQYANLRAWLDGRALTQPQVDAVTNELAAAWWNARMTGIYSVVADVLRDVILWGAVFRMRQRDQDVVRRDLVRRREAVFAPPQWTEVPTPSTAAAPAGRAESVTPAAPSPPPVRKTPRVSDAEKDWVREHGSFHTELMKGLLTPIPPIKLYP